MLDKDFYAEVYTFIIKVFIPAFVAIAIKTAIQMKRERLNLMRILISFIAGIGAAYFVYTFTHQTMDSKYIPLLVGIVAMTGERIAEYILYKWDIDKMLTTMIDMVINKIKK